MGGEARLPLRALSSDRRLRAALRATRFSCRFYRRQSGESRGRGEDFDDLEEFASALKTTAPKYKSHLSLYAALARQRRERLSSAKSTPLSPAKGHRTGLCV